VNKEHREEDNMPKKGTKSKKEKVDDVPNEQENKLPDYLELQRTRVVCNADAPIHVDTFTTLLSCIC
jgi:DNA-directed RNA polymerases I and III subunit RPAC1